MSRLFFGTANRRVWRLGFGSERLLCILLLLTLETVPASGTEDDSPPNIVMLLADDLGWTGLGCYGSDFYKTPNLDALADSGLRFTDAYAACTVCSPTRASVMTGMYPARLHLTDFIAGQNRPYAKMSIPDWTKRLDEEHVTIAEVLHDAGYRTGHVGKWHLNARAGDADGTMPTDQGFDVSFIRPPKTKSYRLHRSEAAKSGSRYLTDRLTDHACEFIERSAGEPFFLYFAYHVPHTPIQGREDLVKEFTAKVDPDATHNNPVYAAMVASLDQSVGRVVDQLRSSGVDEDTLIVFTSDNGGLTQRYGKHDGFTENLPLRRGKGSAYEGGVRVPAIVTWPGVVPPGTATSVPIMTIDWFPTFAAVAGQVTDVSPDGVDLTPLLSDPSTELARSLFWHYPHYHAGGDGPYSAVRSGDYRLIHFHADDSLRLYDLDNDIGERDDRSQDESSLAQRLYAELQQWRAEVGAQMPTPNPDHDPARATELARANRATTKRQTNR